jgi:hypothetical protein
MGIRLLARTEDPQGFPVIVWQEDRNVFAPHGGGRARIDCFIRPNEHGELQFVSAGAVRYGGFEKERSWAKLVSFSIEKADQLYYSAANRALIDVVASKSKSGAGRLFTTDGAFVILANFADEWRTVPMHLNCAACAPVEVAELHNYLHSTFIANRPAAVEEHNGGEFVWPHKKPFVAYEPPAPVETPLWMEWASNLIAAAVVGAIGFGFYWLVIR